MASRLTHTLRGVVKSVQRHGVLAAIGYVFDQVRVGRSERAERFDEQHGTLTEGKVYSWELSDLDAAAVSGGVHPYEATPAWLIRKIIRSLPIAPARFVFVDMGSGKGRTLLLASEFSFSRIVGVEVVRELHETAISNVSLHVHSVVAPANYDLRCMNATQYEFEDDPLVVFLFNPFGKDAFDTVISRLEESFRRCRRDIYVVYLNPRFAKRFRGSPVFRRLRSYGSRLRPWRHYVVYHAKPVQ